MSKVTTKKYSQKFRKEWLKCKSFNSWLCELPADPTKAYCKLCKCEIQAKYCQLVNHKKTNKHISAYPVGTKPITNFIVQKCNKVANVEAKFALFVCCHTAIATSDHLVDMCKNVVNDSLVMPKVKMHRSKCSGIIKNVLGQHFEEELVRDIGNRKFSLLLDESNDISVNKLLGIAIVYYSNMYKKVIYTFLSLVLLEKCDALAIVNALKNELLRLKLDLKNMVAIGKDNASVMVGINNGIYKQLKAEVPSLILIKCACHSIQLAVSHAAAEFLPKWLEYLVAETYKWFSFSSVRQAAYKQLYETINSDQCPLKLVNKCATRWLSLEPAVGRILIQWLELKTHFGVTSSTEKCYTAEVLYNMYKDDRNLLYILFLHPVLVQLQQVIKLFESNTADKVKLLNDLCRMIKSIAQMIILPTCRVDPLQSDISDYLDSRPNLGYRFERKAEELRNEKRLLPEDEMHIRNLAKKFLLGLYKQLKQRLPDNLNVLQNVSYFSVDNILRHVKPSAIPVLQMILSSEADIAAAEFQYNSIHLSKWNNITSTEQFWIEVNEYSDSSGENPFKELAQCALNLLILPNSNAEVERIFSSMNIVKNKLRNKMELPMLKAILHVKYGLRRTMKCCKDYELPSSVLNIIGTMAAYENDSSEFDAVMHENLLF